MKTGYTHEELLQRLAVSWSITSPSTHGRPDYKRNSDLIVVHITKFRHMVDHLISDQRDEITKHDLDYWSQSAQCHPSSNPKKPRFGDWRG